MEGDHNPFGPIREEGPRASVKVTGKLVSDSAVVFTFSVAAPPAPHSPGPSLPEGERGERPKRASSLSPPLPRGEEG